MGAAQILILIDAVLTGVETLAPRIGELVQKGEITPEQQQKLLARVRAIQDSSAFSAPHWKPRE